MALLNGLPLGTRGCGPVPDLKMLRHIPFKAESWWPIKLGRQKVGYGMVVDGIAKFQALEFTFQGPNFSKIPRFAG